MFYDTFPIDADNSTVVGARRALTMHVKQHVNAAALKTGNSCKEVVWCYALCGMLCMRQACLEAITPRCTNYVWFVEVRCSEVSLAAVGQHSHECMVFNIASLVNPQTKPTRKLSKASNAVTNANVAPFIC